MESEVGLLEGLSEVAAVEGCCRSMVEPENALAALAAQLYGLMVVQVSV
jgi:hypothetical protein